MASEPTVTKNRDAGKLRVAVLFPLTRSRSYTLTLPPRRGDGGCRIQAAFACHSRDDLFAVEAAILDENLRGVFAADDHAGQVNARNIAFERVGIQIRLAVAGIETNSLLLEKIEIGMIAGHRKDLRRGQHFFAHPAFYVDAGRFDARHIRAK